VKFSTLVLAAVATMFGQTVADPYRWLESAQSSRTQAWIDRQNAETERVLSAYPQRGILAKRIRELTLTGPQRFSPQLAGDTLFYMRETPPQPQPVLVAQRWPIGAPRVIADASAFGPDASIDEVWPSPSGALVAIGTSRGGSEATTIRILDVRHARVLPDALGPAGGGTTDPVVAWDRDGRALTYGRLPLDGTQFGIELYHHVLGRPQRSDALSLGAISPVAEYHLLTSTGAGRAAALVQFGDGSPYRVYRRSGSHWRSAIGPEAGILSGAFVGENLLLVAAGGSPHGRVARLQADGTLATVVPEAPDWALHDIYPIRGGFLAVKSWGTAWRIDHYDPNGKLVRSLALPRHGIGVAAIASSDTQARALVAYSGWAGPVDRWATYDATSGRLRTVYDVKPSSSGYANIRVREIEATSKDGTRIPVTVLALAGTPQDGRAPAILTGYGGFDIAEDAHFIGPGLAWLEMGGVYAVANIRGGSEFGEDWHRDGMLTKKQNVFDDFYASAKALVAERWTSSARLGIEGGSNGGLLVGAALVQHPDEYRAVVGAAGIYDAVRHHVFPNGAYNVTEYGSVDDEAQFRAIYAYSPYHHVESGTAYPAVLLLTSENDPRVAPWQTWKFGAALENATVSKRPVIVLTRRSGGHGHGASFAQRVGNYTVELTFLAQQLAARPH
jgi:prolyl oligopeptidase